MDPDPSRHRPSPWYALTFLRRTQDESPFVTLS